MGAEALAEVVERGWLRWSMMRERVEALAQVGVLACDALDVWVLGTGVPGECRQQEVLFEAEVLADLAVPEADRVGGERFDVVDTGAFEAQREFEREVVLAGSRAQASATT
ncbi:MAG TPA: hypothetical protein VGI50_19310 [Solirubrobacteraceae bacterium]|jgi:hypothetical protein